MSGDTTENSENMSNTEIRPGSEKPRRTLSIRERLALLTAASALGLTALFPRAASAEDSQSAIQPRVERAGAPDVQVDENSYCAISPDAIEKTPVPKPTATPRPTTLPAVESSRVVVAAFPTPTTTPISPDVQASQVFTESLTTEPEVKASEIYVANIELGANLRAGAGTNFEVVDSVQQDKNRELQLVDFDTTMALTSYNWFRLTGVLDENGNPVDVYVRSDLIKDVTLVQTQDAGPNTGGAVVSPEASPEDKEQEVTIEQLAEMMDGVTLGGDNPLKFSDENGEKTILEAYVRIILDQTGMSLAELAEIIKSEGKVEIKIPAPNPENPNRSPTIISETSYTISVVPARGIAVNRPSNQAAADKEIQKTMIIASQPGDLPLSIMNRQTGELAGAKLNISTTGTFFIIFVDENGKFTLYSWEQSAKSASYSLFVISVLLGNPGKFFDVKGNDGFYSKITWSSTFGKDFGANGDNTVMSNLGPLKLPVEFNRDRYFVPTANFKGYESAVFTEPAQ